MKKIFNYFTPVGDEQKALALVIVAVAAILFIFPILSYLL